MKTLIQRIKELAELGKPDPVLPHLRHNERTVDVRDFARFSGMCIEHAMEAHRQEFADMQMIIAANLDRMQACPAVIVGALVTVAHIQMDNMRQASIEDAISDEDRKAAEEAFTMLRALLKDCGSSKGGQ